MSNYFKLYGCHLLLITLNFYKILLHFKTSFYVGNFNLITLKISRFIYRRHKSDSLIIILLQLIIPTLCIVTGLCPISDNYVRE